MFQSNSLTCSYRRLFKMPRSKTVTYAAVCVAIITGFYSFYSYGYTRSFFGYAPFTWNYMELDSSQNYFKELTREVFLVSNEKCQIPELGVWEDPGVVALRKTVYKTRCDTVNLTFVQGQRLFINQEKVQELGYSETSQMSCCYRTIERVTQKEPYADKEADNHFRYSKSCYKMEPVTDPVSGFILVLCQAPGFLGNRTIYKNVHLLAKLPKTKEILKKKRYWKDFKRHCANCSLPANVLLIGIDSTSRLNFHRYMPQTMKVLRSLQAIEMKGYTKVGENTFPNFIPLTTSYSEDEIRFVCNYTRWKPIDKCPFIWKDFSKQNYLTALLEDSPKMAIFNYMKTGFVNPPTDVYLRPWTLAGYKEEGDKWTVNCLGYQRPEEVILNYIADFASEADRQSLPYFLSTWLTDLTHEDMHSIQIMDYTLANTLYKLGRKKLLENTVLLVMSDHGYRFADVRVTMSGWYEDKLPAMFMKVPNKMLANNPSWKNNLKLNGNQLTTPFDVHATLKQVLNVSSKVPHKPLRGLSLFHKLPVRNCEEAGVPPEYCACSAPVPALSKSRIEAGAEAIINHINQKIPSVCRPLCIREVIAAAKLPNQPNPGSGVTQYIVSVTTSPGNFRFEAMLTQIGNDIKQFSVTNLLRTNKKTMETDCLNDSQAEFELICYCKSTWW